MRLLRAVVATVVVIGLAASAHSLGGGASLTPVAALVLATLVGPLVWALTRTRTSLPRMLTATLAGQVVTHVLLAGMAPAATGTAARAHVHEGVSLASAAEPTAHTALHLGPSMVLAHVVATLVAGLLLTLGADVVGAVLRGVLAVVRTLPAMPRRAVAALVDALVRPRDGRVVGPLGGRAPPPQAC